MTAESKTQDILLVGFGAVGVVYAYLLEQSGKARVTAVARGNFDLIQAHGLRLDAPAKWGLVEGYRPHRLVRSVREASDRRYHLVIVTTKALPDVLPAEQLLRPIIDAGCARTFLLIQNGLGIEHGLYEATRKIDATILSSVCHISTNLVGNRDQLVLDDDERLIVGIYHPPESYKRPPPAKAASCPYWLPAQTPAQTEALESVVQLIRTGGGNIEVERDVELFRFHKVIFNSTWAAVACLARAPLENFLPVLDLVGPSIFELLEEVALIGRTANLPLAPGFAQHHFDATVAQRRRAGGRHRPSALVDILTGRPFEVECTLGNVLRLGRRVGVPEAEMPLLRLAYGLGRVIQAGLIRKEEAGVEAGDEGGRASS